MLEVQQQGIQWLEPHAYKGRQDKEWEGRKVGISKL
jgi:hypothetical protein